MKAKENEDIETYLLTGAPKQHRTPMKKHASNHYNSMYRRSFGLGTLLYCAAGLQQA